MENNDLQNRLFKFSIEVLKYLPTLPHTTEFKVIRHQLARSATSTGANYEESQASSSRADFNNRVRIALREMRETNYWLRTIKEILDNPKSNIKLENFLKESDELMKILGSIVVRTKKL